MREPMILQHDAETGCRLKHFSRAADVEYWTELWERAREDGYERELRGHLPHQLRSTFRRWVKPGARTLEAGCGLGHFTVAAHALGYRAEGLDWSGTTIEKLRRRFSWIPWHVGDVRQLAFPDDTFDAIYSPGVCEHFEEGPADILRETRRVLRPGGIAVISTPCFNAWLQQRVELVTEPHAPDALGFFQYVFTPEGLSALLRRLGFDVLQIRPYAALDTLVRFGGWHVPRRMEKVLAFSMDCLPRVRDWGSTCIWVARKG